MKKEIKEVKEAIELAEKEIVEWKSFLKIAKERLKKLTQTITKGRENK